MDDQNTKSEFREPLLTRYLKEIVYGGYDGILTTFAVVAGFSGASLFGTEMVTLTFSTVLLFGFANLFADSISMGLGDIQAEQSDQELYQTEKAGQIKRLESNLDIKETSEILVKKGFSQEEANQLTIVMSKNKNFFAEFILNYKYSIPNNLNAKPWHMGIATMIAFMIFGVIPLFPFLLETGDHTNAFFVSATATLFSLTLLGLLKWKVIGGKPLKLIFQTLSVGLLSAVVAFGVGVFIGG